jgi:hypothetical protein
MGEEIRSKLSSFLFNEEDYENLAILLERILRRDSMFFNIYIESENSINVEIYEYESLKRLPRDLKSKSKKIIQSKAAAQIILSTLEEYGVDNFEHRIKTIFEKK